MRRLILVCLLLWLPLQGAWATAAVGCLHGSGPADAPAGHHSAAADALPAADTGPGNGNAGAGDADEGCPLCQGADWQAAPAVGLPVVEGSPPAPPTDAPLAIRSHVPPVPKPPARRAAA